MKCVEKNLFRARARAREGHRYGLRSEMAKKKTTKPKDDPRLQLLARVEAGMTWLAEHDSDPPGRFYMWWQAKLRPGQRMPAQPQEVQDRYAEWYRGFNSWLRLYHELEQLCSTD